jgi:hypothetical protein
MAMFLCICGFKVGRRAASHDLPIGYADALIGAINRTNAVIVTFGLTPPYTLRVTRMVIGGGGLGGKGARGKQDGYGTEHESLHRYLLRSLISELEPPDIS